ncbi:MAG: outer membrane beta-barrel protein [Cyclobacteriaceae bacterium]|nr:outer membrane beta-barrel protein [Cyclobacteriaceae bacterium]
MKSLFFKTYFAVFFLTTYTLFGQSSENLPEPKRFIDKVEAFGGVALDFPNDKGWDTFISNSSNGKTIYESKEKTGYIIGIILIHSLKKRFEIQGRFSLEQRKYFESYVTLDSYGQPYSKSIADQKNNYITFSLVPTYFLLKSNRLHLFSGLSYSYLTKSLAFGETYVNGQYVGSACIDTIDGFEKQVVDALAGVGYFFSLSEKFSCVIRIQGNYGLSNSIMQNNYRLTVNSLSLALAIRYSR